MDMRRLAAAIGCALPLLAARAAPPAADPAAALLDRARLWESRDRPELAREMLEKLFRMAPDHPDGLAELGMIEARAGSVAAARATLEKLRRLKPDHPGIARIEGVLRLAAQDKDKLRQARQLGLNVVKGGRLEDLPKALAAYRALFGGAEPDGDLALEYWQLAAEDPRNWDKARDGLARLTQRYPDNLHYRFALAEHELSRPPLNRRALQTVIDMTNLPEFQRAARAAWRRAILRLDPEAGNRPLLEQYLEREPNDSLMQQRIKDYAEAEEAHRRLLADPAYRARVEGVALMDKGDLDGAAQRFADGLRERPSDAELAGGMGLVMLRQGHHAQAQAWFEQALRGQPDQAGKWRSLIATARFWGLLREAADARGAADYALAEDKLREAMKIEPREPQAWIALARVQGDQRRFDAADESYRQALALEPANRTALGERLGLMVRAGRADEARRIIAGLDAAQRGALGKDLGAIEAGMLRAEADDLTAHGRRDEAVAVLERAVKLDAADPWLRFDLARLYAARGEKARATALFDDMLARHPGDTGGLYALALLQSSSDDDLSALHTLERIAAGERDAKVTRMQRELWLRVNLQRAAQARLAGRTEQARALLEETERAVAGDDALTARIALAWADAGDMARARRIFEAQRTSGRTLPVDGRLDYAGLLLRAGAGDEMERVLAELPAQLEPAQAERVARLREDQAVGAAEAELAAGDAAAARARLARIVAQRGERPALLLALARAEAAAGDRAAADATLRRALAADPRYVSARQELAELLALDGRREEALAQVKAGLVAADDSDVASQATLLGLLVDLDARDMARPLAAGILQRAPDNADALLLAGRLALADDRPDEAIALLQRGLAAEHAADIARGKAAALTALRPAAQQESGAAVAVSEDTAGPAPAAKGDYRYRKLAELIDERADWLTTGIDRRDRVGTEGYSQYVATEIPVEMMRPLADGGRMFVRAERTEVRAGHLNMNDATAQKNFGGMAICRPNCADPGDQTAQGTALGIGYQKKDFRADFGTTPIGFPVNNWVGGIADKIDIGPFTGSAELSRRPVTGSLLSYAGTRDPYSGRTWGGVVATGLRLGLSRDSGGALGFWSSLGLHQLTGHNVQDNTRRQLMAGGYWRVVNRDDQILSVGLTGMDWRFARDAGEYTFGHGGYYSPGHYTSLSLPLTYSQRFERFSYVLRGAVSTSRSQTGAAPYYPTDPQMMAAAVAAGVNPNYSASTDAGKARGKSFHFGWEYQLDARLFLGGRFEVERSPDYAPNRSLVYLRWNLDRAAAQPVRLPPEPLLPYSQF